MGKLLPWLGVLIVGLYIGHVTADPPVRVIEKPAKVKIVREPGQTVVNTVQSIPVECVELIRAALIVPEAAKTVGDTQATLETLTTDAKVAIGGSDVPALSVLQGELMALARNTNQQYNTLIDYTTATEKFLASCADASGVDPSVMHTPPAH